MTDIPFYDAYKKLEDDFVVVHYDQRGASKSFYLNQNVHNFQETLSVEQHVVDAIAVCEWILNKSALASEGVHKKLYLLGASYPTNKIKDCSNLHLVREREREKGRETERERQTK